MKRTLWLLIAAGFATSALGGQEAVFRQGDLTVRLTQAECAIPPIAVALEAAGGLTQPKAAAITSRGSEVRGCWSVDKDADVLIGDETGAGGFIPATQFKIESGV